MSNVRPLVLVRGFGGVSVTDEQRNAYQGFNDGTVYPRRRGENFIYEGFVLRALKSVQYPYTDATNVIGYYSRSVEAPEDLGGWAKEDLQGSVALDPRTADVVLQRAASGTIWVYRYYDLNPRTMRTYGAGLLRLVRLIEKAMQRHERPFEGVDVVAHSMGGLVVRNMLETIGDRDEAERLVHRVVTLGTPHRGIAFAGVPRWVLQALPKIDNAGDELDAFDPERDDFLRVPEQYDPRRILTVVGTDFRSYNVPGSSAANRLTSLVDEGTLSTNRSDGLVKQSAAQLPGSPRTFVHKCHGGPDSLVTSREAYEIAMRFFHGTHHVRLWLEEAEVKRGKDFFGRSELYFGATIKPRGVDFELFHQSDAAENTYGPFSDAALTKGPPTATEELSKTYKDEGPTTGWLDEDRLVWEGWIDEGGVPDPNDPEMVFRLDLYVGERDSWGLGFSDNVIFRKQYYVQVYPGVPIEMFVHTGEQFLRRADRPSRTDVGAAADDPAPGVERAVAGDNTFTFAVGDAGFSATLRVGIDREPSA